MDAIEGMQGNGPSGGDLYAGQRLLAPGIRLRWTMGALKLFGVEPELTPIHREAVKLGLVDPRRIELIAVEEAWEDLCREDFTAPETMKD